MANSKWRRRNRNLLFTALGAVVLVAGLVVLTGNDGVSDPDPAPDVRLEYFDGTTGTLQDLEGRPVVLNFWASWCPTCVTEMPSFAEVHRQFGDRVSFVGVNMQEVSLDAAVALADRTGVDYPLVHDPSGEIFRSFGGLAMPTTVFIRADGSVARVHAGGIFSDELTNLIERELLG